MYDCNTGYHFKISQGFNIWSMLYVYKEYQVNVSRELLRGNKQRSNHWKWINPILEAEHSQSHQIHNLKYSSNARTQIPTLFSQTDWQSIFNYLITVVPVNQMHQKYFLLFNSNPQLLMLQSLLATIPLSFSHKPVLLHRDTQRNRAHINMCIQILQKISQ